mmetsp:Transcript_19027/g.37378  ORF Transcript_19027/g.37378 Transcript_19027/m.37378 type:complete len:315 (+) Transcript_19027:57-1001(+)
MTNFACTCFFEEVPLELGAPGSPESEFGLEQTVYRVGPYDIAITKADAQLGGDLLYYERGQQVDRTGMLMWPGGTVIAHALLNLGNTGALAGRSVLELGSGVGFCGIVANLFAGQVVLTDRSHEARATARENLRLNEHLFKRDMLGAAQSGVSAEVLNLAWPVFGHPGKPVDETGTRSFDLVIASDVLYVEEPRFGGLHDKELNGFCSVIKRKLAPGGLALMAYANRETHGIASIFAAANHIGLECSEVPVCSFVSAEVLGATGAGLLSATRLLQFTLETPIDGDTCGLSGSLPSMVSAVRGVALASAQALGPI